MIFKRMLIIALVGIAPGLASCSGQEGAKAPDPARPVILVTANATRDLPPAKYAGTLRSEFENRLSFRFGGQVTARLVDMGTTVAAGQVLMRLDTRDAELSARAAEGQMQAADAAARAQSADLERSAQLFKDGFISRSELDRQSAAASQARAQLTSARAQQETSTRQVGYAALVAPRASAVSGLNAEVGDVVAAGQAVVTLSDPRHIEVAISVPEDQVSALQRADSLWVTLWAQPGVRLKGQLRTVASVADSTTRTFDARIRLPANSANARLGQTAEVEVFQRSAAPVLRVPLTAIDERGGKTQVWVVEPTRMTIRPVTVVVSGVDHDTALIASGLTSGQRVVATGVHVLRSGEVVRPAKFDPRFAP